MTANIKGLKAASQYSFKVVMAYGEGNSKSISLFSMPSARIRTKTPDKPMALSSHPRFLKPSDWNRTLGTMNNGNINDSYGKNAKFIPSYGSEATMIILDMLAPYDDGGHEIIGYDVMMIELDSKEHDYIGDWQLLTHRVEEICMDRKVGGSIRLGIHNLVPERMYHFKVAARIMLGRSEWSHSSEKGFTHVTPNNHKNTKDYASHNNNNRRRRLSSTAAVKSHGYIPSNGYQIHGIQSE